MTGDRVVAGQVLVRLDAHELGARLMQLRKAAQAVEESAKGGSALAQLPSQLQQYLTEMHPDTARADREYVEALAALEQAKDAEREAANVRVRRAAQERVKMRRSLGQLFSARANGDDPRFYLADISRSMKELERLLLETEVRAPSRAVVDLIDVHAGEEIQPGQPIAVLVSTEEYLVDLGTTADEMKRLHTGLALHGRLDGSGMPIDARIESISMRKIPVIARDSLRAAEEPVVRARIVSATLLRPGIVASFELP